jgi:hypothetical protein
MRPNPLQPPTMNYLVFLADWPSFNQLHFSSSPNNRMVSPQFEYISVFLFLWANSFSEGVQFHRGRFNHSAMAFYIAGAFLLSVGVFTFCGHCISAGVVLIWALYVTVGIFLIYCGHFFCGHFMLSVAVISFYNLLSFVFVKLPSFRCKFLAIRWGISFLSVL